MLLSCWLLSVTTMVNAATPAADTQSIQIGYLELQHETPPLLSNVLPDPQDNALQGALLGISDNNAGGRFLGLAYSLEQARSYDEAELLAALHRFQQQGIQLLLVNAPAQTLTTMANQYPELLFFNVGSYDDSLRLNQCVANVLHTLPSRAMLTDAMAQWLIRKKLKKWLLISGTRPEDKDYANAVRRSAKRFGGKIVAAKDWTFDSDLRRSAQTEVPLFTQTKEYDAVVVADEVGDFGEFLLYNTWYPRPVTGTQGLKPVGWHRVIEQWGAAQLQSRFDRQASRWMTDKDYAAWAAIRSIGESLSHQIPYSATDIRSHLLSSRFELAGFKGRKLTYRHWNGQLRQPIALVHPRALVSQSPQEGYLHPYTELDTLGFDQPESQCRLVDQAD
ncbi:MULTISPECIES: ABC transporter substrate-binding protein [unclassified Oceanobacter]|uniref:ABC transporter substrate-binding protein n=1 Tax=unclassified Oceanobacter TaxID=2620260 RepID=UPI00273367F3|nr:MULTISPECIES: ABC transporter substrate-binding protein [unclassified Oceanobacter]MDP2506134.1 ABC transporter substrate-binding protein [Oceanobacter sp. 3_MG-2023]MDP2547323.1 ABC transporter substrate-binding protein [Oceanobacter sp. 4_MG-2023]MDP2607449.1 ABC transporter substrate-binding protein [Oceanobacter sp. 1_MG-2023]MDP2610717.1 ABC transporter substrate-binding protein [Oceanobacter sp. 2_MG-2023]